ncbi:hypothetical protein DSL72_008075 [Monilinia vaccinii-corymbosi]|uniref:Uncharacterized protein n=1 Tax=Monilinia vaccinii-corymbosi TaxID=61207 RepID=A0A8A3PIW1_9HELO|nr:hypothetical protein DSL72_008075 [Monilinia vaccinii-corymbosi]
MAAFPANLSQLDPDEARYQALSRDEMKHQERTPYRFHGIAYPILSHPTPPPFPSYIRLAPTRYRTQTHNHNLKSPHLLPPPLPPPLLTNITKQLRLQNKLALLVLLTRLIRLVVFPAHRLVAPLTHDIAHDVSTRSHVAFGGIAGHDIDDEAEEVGFAVLAAEVLGGGGGGLVATGWGEEEEEEGQGEGEGTNPGNNVFVRAQVCFAILAAVDFIAVTG